MRGYFGIGAEGISKAMNVGALMRTTHAFGGSFFFTVAAGYDRSKGAKSDTSNGIHELPLFEFADVGALRLPKECRLVGIEFAEDAIELPSFHHPRAAAYVFGSERRGLSAELSALCDHVVRIPTRFSINVGLAGAIVMYDRMLSMSRFAPRPVSPGGPTEPAPVHAFGEPLWVRKQRRRTRETKPVDKQGD
ncbi:MAG: RNA methyltransferase [Alphaproteobacteria bacterium]